MINKFKTFCFLDNVFDEDTGKAEFNFSLDDTIFFKESIDFGKKGKKPKGMDDLHIALGVSYYKTYLPREIVIKNYKLNKEQSEFWESFYKNGLSEFCYRNKKDISDLKFPYDAKIRRDIKSIDSGTKKIVIPVGGGKDSTVVVEAIKHSELKAKAISVGLPRPIKDTILKSGLDNILLKREISKNIKNFPDALNGHVPISGIIAFMLLCAAEIYDFNTVLMANERSANQGNAEGVNHQWSKSFEFEESFNLYVRNNIFTGFNYISFLRPLSELMIAKLFSKLKGYHDIFTSCNKAFKLDKEKRIDYWCADCDKCRFVFLILAVFMKKQDLVKIFKKNMLDDMNNLKGYEELTGISGIKPFECVGEIEECITAFQNLDDEWKNDKIVLSILPFLQKGVTLEEYLKSSDKHLLDNELKDILDAFIRD